MHPELGLEEKETSAYMTIWRNWGARPRFSPGMIAELLQAEKGKNCGGKGRNGRPSYGEKTGLPYASVNPGRMHACGHDGILAVALTLCGILSEEKEEFPVNVRFLFEPAEEIGEGGKRMIKAGALDGPADAF